MVSVFDRLRYDIHYAVRTIRTNPGFSAVAVLSLALGAGANTAIFQLLDAVRLRTLPIMAPDQLVEVRIDDMTHARGTWLREAALTHPLWERLRGEREALSGLFAWADETLETSTGGEVRKTAAVWVSGEFFRVLGVPPILGRVFADSDDRRGCGQAAGVVLSYRFWQNEFGGDPAIVGRQVSIGKMRPEVIGVTSPTFSGLDVGRTFDVAIPICAEPAWHGMNARLDSGTVWWLTVMGRLKPDVSFERAAAILRAKSSGVFAATLPPDYPAASITPYLAMHLVAIPAAAGLSQLRAQYSRALVLLFGLTAFVLMIACVNLAHLMLARATARRREIAVRLSLGASAARLAQQLLMESLLLAIGGVAVGLLLARAISRVLISLLATDANNVFLDLSMDLRTFAFLGLLSIVTCLVFAALPVWRVSRVPPAGSLAARRQADIPGGERAGVRRGLLAFQIALSLALLVGTLLFVRSLRNLERLDAGFQQRGVVVADVNFSDLQLPSDYAISFRRDMLQRIRANPVVQGAAEVLILPISGGNWNNRVWTDDADAEQARVVMRNMIGPDYFRTLNTPVIAGREFDDRDITASAPKIVVINERLAREFGLGPDPIGRHLWIEPTPREPQARYEIVGMVANTKYHDLREDDPPILYVPLWQAALRRPAGQFVIRSAGQTDALLTSLRTTLAGIDSKVRYSFRPLDDVVQRSLLRERLMATLAVPFGTLAVILAALGLYGVFSHTVAQRTREIGIRMALGADRRVIIGSILAEAAVVLLIGVSSGAIVTLAAGRAASTLLFGVTPYDPISVGAAGVLLAGVTLIATYVPARRAASVDPAIALRHE